MQMMKKLEKLQKLTETTVEQNEEKTAELDTAEKETDLIDHKSIYLWSGEF